MALSAARNTPKHGTTSLPQVLRLPVKDTKKIYAGSLVVINAGYAEPASTSTGKLAVGRAEATVDNGAGVTGHADGFVSVDVMQGTFSWANSAGDAVAAADVGKTVYIEDDQTISKTNAGGNTQSAAGRLVGFDSAGNPMVCTFLGVG